MRWQRPSALAILCLTLIADHAQAVSVEKAPGAVIVEQCFAETKSTEEMFYVTAIDGVPVRPGCVRRATQGASAGGLTPVTATRRLAPHPQRVTLVASHRVTPEEAAASRSGKTAWYVEGDVNFDPTPGGRYFVAGELKETGSSVWIADLQTGLRVSEIVASFGELDQKKHHEGGEHR